MDWSGLAVAAVPPVAYSLVAFRHRGFARQPHVVMAVEPGQFKSAVLEAGGTQSVRTGVWLDIGFIATLTVPSGVLLARSDLPALVAVAVVAAVIDLAEDATLLRALNDAEEGTLRRMRLASRAKVVAYLALLVAVPWALVQ